MTAGTAEGEGTWRVPVRELARAAVMPPPDFVGTMNLSVDLRLADSSVADSDVQQLKWTASAPDFVVAKPVTTTVVKPESGPSPPPVPLRAWETRPAAADGEIASRRTAELGAFRCRPRVSSSATRSPICSSADSLPCRTATFPQHVCCCGGPPKPEMRRRRWRWRPLTIRRRSRNSARSAPRPTRRRRGSGTGGRRTRARPRPCSDCSRWHAVAVGLGRPDGFLGRSPGEPRSECHRQVASRSRLCHDHWP